MFTTVPSGTTVSTGGEKVSTLKAPERASEKSCWAVSPFPTARELHSIQLAQFVKSGILVNFPAFGTGISSGRTPFGYCLPLTVAKSAGIAAPLGELMAALAHWATMSR